MRRYLALLMVAGLAATLAGPSEAGQGQSTPKPKNPPSSGGSQSSGGQPAALDTHANQAAQAIANRLRALAARELDGAYLSSSDRNDKLPPFDGDWGRDGIGQKLITLETSSPIAALRNQIVAELLARGISVRPTAIQLQALQNPTARGSNTVLNFFLSDIELNRGFRNTQIESRAPNNIYDRVDVSNLIDPYDSFATLLAHNGPNGTDHANHYTPAPSQHHH